MDQPPLIAWITWIARSLFGLSLPAIRFLAAVAGAGEVALSALIARELGGKRLAQGLAALATLGHRPVRAEVRLAARHQRASELLPVGSAWLLRRKCHRYGGTAAGPRVAFRRSPEGRQRLSPLLHAIRAFRRLLLPWSQAAAARDLAAGEELGLTRTV